MTICLQAEQRSHLKPSSLRNLRKSGRLPGVIFGKHAENEMILLSTIEFQKWLKQGTVRATLQVDGNPPIAVLLEDVQRDPITRDVTHVDFQRVQTDTVIRTKIPVKFLGTPVGTKQGGVVQIQCASIEVEALPKDLPSELEVDISEMNIGDSLHVQDIPFSAAVKVVSEPHEFLLSIVK